MKTEGLETKHRKYLGHKIQNNKITTETKQNTKGQPLYSSFKKSSYSEWVHLTLMLQEGPGFHGEILFYGVSFFQKRNTW